MSAWITDVITFFAMLTGDDSEKGELARTKKAHTKGLCFCLKLGRQSQNKTKITNETTFFA
jgi:hypothetical protein